MPKTDPKALDWLHKYLRLTDYVGAASLYLKDNFFLKDPLTTDHIKERILGHWGTVPGLNFIYANLNYLISKHGSEMLLVTGPGHGAPAILANLFTEGSIQEFYPRFSVDGEGMGHLIKDFSWPHTKFPSHVTPNVPGSILEGGELGYSLSTAYGAALDNPDLIVAAVVGDGEAESGPVATAWHANKFLNPKTSGAVLPIVHINGFKISNPTLYGKMDNEELTHLFTGYGYEPMIVELPDIEEKMFEIMERAYQMIRAIQEKARAKGADPVLKPKWPVILLRSPKGWKGVKELKGKPIEGSFNSHGIPLENPKKDPEELKAIEEWLRSYHINELLDENGSPRTDVMEFVPKAEKRMGMNKHAIGGNMLKDLILPDAHDYETKFKRPGEAKISPMGQAAKQFRDIYKLNPDNFRMFCPDEMVSNKLGGVFEATQRGFMWPINDKVDEHYHPEGRVIEMLSEHTLQGMLQGYMLTGRHGAFVSYEAFTCIINSMLDQYAKFLKQSLSVEWRTPIGSPLYILSSVGWRQDHNGYSHQNPSFVSSVLQKHGEFSQVYYPADANALLVAVEEALRRRDNISVIVAGKRDLPVWQTLESARKQAETGIAIWDWATDKEQAENPDVVLASAGDYITQEAMYAIHLMKELCPEVKIRYVNVSEVSSLALGDICPHPMACQTEAQVNYYFTADKPVVFNYHGYVNDIEQILWPYTTSHRFSLHGYKERGSTTTPFDLKVLNEVDCFHLTMDMIEQVAKTNRSVALKSTKLIRLLQQRIEEHQKYIVENGTDPDEITSMEW